MSTDQTLLLALGLAVIAIVAVTLAYATAYTSRRDVTAGAETAEMDAPRARGSFIASTSTRQVARVVAFLYLASVAMVVALTAAWPDREPAIFTLLAVGTLLVVLFMDLIPPSTLGRWQRPVEGVGAIVFLGLLAALTGGAGSPFFVGFYLVVAGTALSTEGRAPLAIALLAGVTVVFAGLVDALATPLDPASLAWVGFNAVAFILLADIATAAARAQRHARDEALRASRFDSLTGLYNRAFFVTTMEQEIRRSDRMGRSFTMLMLDLDDLKPVNDTFGHQWGDRLLKAVADTIRQTIRFTDSAARYGGDEFVVLLPETDAAGGYVVAEKLRRDIASVTLHTAARNVRSTVSIGLVMYPDDGTTLEQLVAAADVAMYESKRRGKNRIVGYQSRTELVATPIEVEAGDIHRPWPLEGARTGGDPAPWTSLAEERERTTPPAPVAPPGVATHPPGPAAPPPSSAAPPPSGAVSPGAAVSPPSPAEPPPSQPSRLGDEGRAIEERSASSGRADPESQARARPAPPVRAPAPLNGAAAEPWLTRTDDSLTDISFGAGSGPQPGGRDERTGSVEDRPWIVLPIEPVEPPDRPRG